MINNRFKIKKILGEGRSKVFLCADADFDQKEFAVKILPPNVTQEEKDSFENEFFTLRKFNHPNIISASELGVVLQIEEDETEFHISSGSKYFTLELFNGTNLLEYTSFENEENLVEIIKQICSVLYYLHQSNYIYFDLKPENILIAEPNGKPLIKFIDFGFVRFIPAQTDFEAAGTAEYIAPEILKKDPVNYKADLYSLGIMLYRIVYGKFPFSTESELSIYKAHVEKEFEFPASNYSSKIIKVIEKLLKEKSGGKIFNFAGSIRRIRHSVYGSSKKRLDTGKNIYEPERHYRDNKRLYRGRKQRRCFSFARD